MTQRLPQPKFDKGKATAQASAKESLLTIMENTDFLAKVDKKGKGLRAAQSFLAMVERGEELSPGQINYVDGILEMCYKGAGYDSVKLHIDKKKRGLKFG